MRLSLILMFLMPVLCFGEPEALISSYKAEVNGIESVISVACLSEGGFDSCQVKEATLFPVDDGSCVLSVGVMGFNSRQRNIRYNIEDKRWVANYTEACHSFTYTITSGSFIRNSNRLEGCEYKDRGLVAKPVEAPKFERFCKGTSIFML